MDLLFCLCFRLHSVCIEQQNLFARGRLLFHVTKKIVFERCFKSWRAVQAASHSFFFFKNQRREKRARLEERAHISVAHRISYEHNLILPFYCVSFVLHWLSV